MIGVSEPRATHMALVGLALGLQLLALQYTSPEFFVDDAGFFFRYAQSISNGEGFRFNSGETPVWGASAPLWPLALALGLASGFAIESTVHAFALIFSLLSVGLLTSAAIRSAGWAAGLAFGIFAAANGRLTFWAMSGLESPQSYVPIALGICAMVFRRHGVLLGLAVGLAAVQKLDLLPFALSLLVAVFLIEGRVRPCALAVAGAIVIGWYGFAWMHFGSLVPNTVLVKIKTSHPPLPAGWFSENALFNGMRTLLSVLALASLSHLWLRERGAGIVTLGFVAIQVVVYSIRPPAETWGWYTAPIQPVLCWLAALGVSELIRLLRKLPLPNGAAKSFHTVAAVGILLSLGAWSWSLDTRTRLQPWGNDVIDGTRVAAGRWVAEWAAPDWKVLSHFGNPLYYADRYAIDTTRLNRAGPVATRNDLVREYRPEVVIASESVHRLPVDDFLPVKGYRIARVYRRANPWSDFYSVVELREDLPVLDGERGREHKVLQMEQR